MIVPKFIGAFVVASILMVGASILWPKLAKTERPKVLEDIHSQVLGTQIGQDAESAVNSVEIPSNVPSYVASVSSNVGAQALSVVQKKTEEIVTNRIVEEVIRRYETIPDAEKQKMQEIICKPSGQ